MSLPPDWTICLRAEPDGDVPGIQRLRAALKTLLRSYGLRVVTLLPGDRVTGGDAGNMIVDVARPQGVGE